jgi:hypothetical protein
MKTRTRAVALLVVTSMFGPALASSEASGFRSSGRDVVLYELNEEARFTVDKKGREHREASSGLEGKAKVGTPLCPAALMQHAEQVFSARERRVRDASRCAIVAFGKSNLDVTDRDQGIVQGTIKGQIFVVVNSELTNLTDAPELVVMSGKFRGAVVVTDVAIITITEATVTGDGFCTDGCSFTGKFRQPFTVNGIAVYKKDDGDLVPVLPDERALGDPTVRLEITFDRDG